MHAQDLERRLTHTRHQARTHTHSRTRHAYAERRALECPQANARAHKQVKHTTLHTQCDELKPHTVPATSPHTSLVTRASPRGKTTCGLKCERCTATALPKPLLCSHPRYSGLGYHGEYIPLYQVALLSMPHAYNALRNRNGTCRNRHCPPASVQDRRPSL